MNESEYLNILPKQASNDNSIHLNDSSEPPVKKFCHCQDHISTRIKKVNSLDYSGDNADCIFNDKLVDSPSVTLNTITVMGGALCVTSKNSELKSLESNINDHTNNARDESVENSSTNPKVVINLAGDTMPVGRVNGKTAADSTVTTPISCDERQLISRNLSSSAYDANCDPNGKYTFEEITQHLQTRFTQLLQCDSFSDTSTTDDLRFIKRRTNYNPSNTFRLRIADKMDELGVLQLFMRIWHCIHEDDNIAVLASPGLNNLVQVVSTIWNISDISRSLCEKISRCGILEQILQDLNSDSFCVGNLDDSTRMYYVKGVFGILHNICRQCRDSREILRSLDAVPTLQKYLTTDTKSELIHCRTLLILCYLINEHENNVIHADDSHIQYIVTILKSAVESKGHFSRQYGFNAAEILCGLNHLAANDCNKQRIVDSGGLPLYVALLQPGCNCDEQKTAARGLWTLAFSDVCKGHISIEPQAITSLQWLVANSQDERVRHGARGALWEVSARWRVSSQSHEQDTLVSNTEHIMISYQWDAKPVMLRVKDALHGAGYKVWMDVQNMSGSTLEAMALAVERAAAVIICLSQKYKDSPNCRSEAEYSYRLRKRVIPLVLEPAYSPDGWLGIMVGTRLYFDFSEEHLFDTSFEGLAKELGDTGRIGSTTSFSQRAATDTDILMPLGREITPPIERTESAPDFVHRQGSHISNVSMFSSVSSGGTYSSAVVQIQIPFRDFNSWVNEHDLAHQTEKLRSFTVELLREMQRVQRECPKFLYKTLQKEYSLPLVDVLRISRALRRTNFL